MNGQTQSNRNKLKDIAPRPIIQRGLLPDFSPEVRAETNAITRPLFFGYRTAGSESPLAVLIMKSMAFSLTPLSFSSMISAVVK
jgi:hypothetical protein